MSIFSKLLSKKKQEASLPLQFGRYSDGYKTADQMTYWNQAMVHYNQEKFLPALEYLLMYLKESSQDNVHWTIANGQLRFTIYQGSKVIMGEASALHIQVTARIAGYERTDVNWMRLLLEENYSMTFSRFALNNQQEIIIVFDNGMEETLPQKMYEALRELSIRADKMDDILLSEFAPLKPIENKHIIQLDHQVIQVKINFFHEKIEEVLAKINHPNDEIIRCKGSLVFLILACGYTLDYLIKPEGRLMKHIEACHRMYFNDPAESIEKKTASLIAQFKEVLTIKDEDLRKELYDIRSTFGQDLPIGSNGLWEVLDAQWNDLDWYIQNGYFTVHRYICDYVVGFSLFSMSLPEGYKALLHLYYQVTEAAYFQRLGNDEIFVDAGVLKKRKILKAIHAIVSKNNQSEFSVRVDTSLLTFHDLPGFRHSFLFMLKSCIAESL